MEDTWEDTWDDFPTLEELKPSEIIFVYEQKEEDLEIEF
jgi:hypothetical protein